ncbi:MAG: flagellar basal body P-ring formation chaperone FlgA [Desulfobacula sp.]
MNMRTLNFYMIAGLYIMGVFFVYQGVLPDLLADDTQKTGNRIEITIKETSSVGSSHVFLGDIADIKADGFLKEMLEKIDFGASPKPDKIKSLDKRKIVSAIQAERSLPKDIIITCPERIYVKRLSRETSVQDIQKYVELRLSDMFKNKEYELISFTVRGLEPYPPGDISFFSDSEDMVDKNGKLSLFVDIIVDGKKTDRVNVTGLVALYETVFLAKQAFEKGEVLTKENVYQQKKNIFETGNNYIASFEAIEGKKLVSGIRQGECITANLIASSPLIQKGDMVSLVARNNTLLIVTSGVCREDGSENDIIKVENVNSGKIVRAIVKEKSKVEVIY